MMRPYPLGNYLINYGDPAKKATRPALVTDKVQALPARFKSTGESLILRSSGIYGFKCLAYFLKSSSLVLSNSSDSKYICRAPDNLLSGNDFLNSSSFWSIYQAKILELVCFFDLKAIFTSNYLKAPGVRTNYFNP
jgi:hypothetical protein